MVEQFPNAPFNRPIKIEITYENDGYLAYAEELNVYGTGDIKVEAVRDLQLQLKSHYVDLINTPQKELADDALSFVNKIKTLISE